MNKNKNQSVVTIHPREKQKGDAYGLIARKAEIIAGRLLSDRSVAHVLYYYFALNQDNYRFVLDSSDICKRYNITKIQYDSAMKKLKETGYLISDSTKKNGLIFLHIPIDYEDIEIA